MLKKLLFLSLFVPVFMSSALAQKQPVAAPVTLPVDSITKLITYEGVTEVKGLPADTLYARAMEWFKTFYKNPTEVIRETNEEKNSIVGKPRFRISNPADKSGTKTDAGIVQYSINVACKDNRFRFEITEFNWKQLSYYPCERWMDTKSPSYLPAYNDYLQQLDKNANEVINSLKQAMTHSKSVKDRDNW